MALDLPRLPEGQALVDPKTGLPSLAFTVYWQRLLEAVETAVEDIAGQVADIAAALSAANAADAKAVAVAREAARIASYPNPGSVLSAADVGSDAAITVAGHTRVYPVQGSIDVPDVAITGAGVTGLAFSTRYYVYYDDPTLADTTPTFLATTTSAPAQVGASA